MSDKQLATALWPSNDSNRKLHSHALREESSNQTPALPFGSTRTSISQAQKDTDAAPNLQSAAAFLSPSADNLINAMHRLKNIQLSPASASPSSSSPCCHENSHHASRSPRSRVQRSDLQHDYYHLQKCESHPPSSSFRKYMSLSALLPTNHDLQEDSRRAHP